RSLVAQIMNPLGNSKVIDLCSAPGGKSTHMAQLMNNKGYILSSDIHKHKIDLIKQAAARLGIDIIDAGIGDALKNDNKLINTFDYCLLDAPCSGTGAIRRKPEIRWSRNDEDIKALSKIHYKILINASQYLKLGGVLLYSTCSIEKEENILLVKKFLKEHSNFEFVSIAEAIRNKEGLDTLKEGYLQLYPHIHGTDGFFIAKMIKKDR